MDNQLKSVLFTVDSEPVRLLRSRDPRLAQLVDTIGDVTLDLRGSPFASLVRSIIGQQLSGRAAASIWDRLQGMCGEVSPENLAPLSDEKLRSAGLSRPKIGYLHDLCAKVRNGDVDLAGLSALSDGDVITSLTTIKGIGDWTCHMFMIFCLGRLDVFAPNDLGLRRAMMWLYDMPEPPTQKESVSISEAWRPYRTVASLYLWQAITPRLGGPA